MNIISDATLDNMFQQLTVTVSSISMYFHDWCKMQYLYGMRYNETKDSKRWTLYTPSTYSVQCEKGDNHRYILVSQVPQYIQYAISNNLELWSQFRQRTAERWINDYNAIGNIKCGNRGASTYLFRYNCFKQLHLMGYSDDYIASYMGETDTKNVKGYYNAILYY